MEERIKLFGGLLTAKIIRKCGNILEVEIVEDNILDLDANIKKLYPPGRILQIKVI